MGKVHRSEFVKKLKELFPQIRQGINQPHSKPGSLASEIDYFRHFVQKLIDDGDRTQVERAYDAVEWAYQNGNREVREVIDTCFLEDLNFDDSSQSKRGWAREILPKALAQPYEAWLKILHGNVNG